NGKLIRNDFAGTKLDYHSNEISPCECLALDHPVTNGWIIFRINFSSDGVVRDNDGFHRNSSLTAVTATLYFPSKVRALCPCAHYFPHSASPTDPLQQHFQ